eukprot:6412004-Heterocapsa_arctica.AAC.1
MRPPRDSYRSIQGASGDVYCEACPTVVHGRFKGKCPKCAHQNDIPEQLDEGNSSHVRAIHKAENRDLAGNRGFSKIAKWALANLRGNEQLAAELLALGPARGANRDPVWIHRHASGI